MQHRTSGSFLSLPTLLQRAFLIVERGPLEVNVHFYEKNLKVKARRGGLLIFLVLCGFRDISVRVAQQRRLATRWTHSTAALSAAHGLRFAERLWRCRCWRRSPKLGWPNESVRREVSEGAASEIVAATTARFGFRTDLPPKCAIVNRRDAAEDSLIVASVPKWKAQGPRSATRKPKMEIPSEYLPGGNIHAPYPHSHVLLSGFDCACRT